MQSILIVDDIDENLYYLEVLLKGNGFEVRSASNGSEALQSARNALPALIVSDILMPVMDGYALCRECKADECLKKIPFIFYTATFIDKKDEELALSLGADRFVIKPQEPAALMAIIGEVLANPLSRFGNLSAELPKKEGELLKEYNEALFRKLEKKMVELERANQELAQGNMEQKRLVEQLRAEVAERKQAEEEYAKLEVQLRQSQKLESIGTLAGGIAHDFNNILTAIIGYGQITLMKMSADHPQRSNIQYMLDAADRAAHLTRDLLLFSRKQASDRKPVDLNDVVAKMEKFLIKVIGEDISYQTVLHKAPLPVMADKYQLEQVLMNLAINAGHAMPQGGGLVVTTAIVTLDEGFVTAHGYGKPDSYALLTVEDTGRGMDEATRQRIFEPFFTTKEVGKGTGLGLAVVYGIIKQHDGLIDVSSELGKGSTFRIYLPLIAPATVMECREEDKDAVVGGTETILLAEDDELVRCLIKKVLNEYGYTVMEAVDGLDAVRVFRESSKVIDLLLIDIIMPYMNGIQAYDEIRKTSPEIRGIFISGYAPDVINQKVLLTEGAHLLNKPVLPSELLRKVREVLVS